MHDQPPRLPAEIENRFSRVASGDGQETLAQLCAAFPELADDFRRRAQQLADSRHLASLTSGLTGLATPPDAASAERGQRPKYEIQEMIGRGGIGVVYRGRDTDLHRDVALKFLREELHGQPAHVLRFVDEARIGGQLQHPGILPVYELGSADGRPFLAMKLIDGVSLREVLADHDGSETGRARLIGIFEKVCQAVGFAHARGVVHRDLKPSNVLVGGFGEVQVIDWGLAKLAEAAARDDARAVPLDGVGHGVRSIVGAVVGTPTYMSPEQARAESDHATPRTDVFALGGILCEILTGAPPFAPDVSHRSGADRDAALEATLRRLDARDDLDQELVALCTACLAPDPTARPADGGSVAERVRAYLVGVESRAQQARVDASAARHRQRALAGVAVTVLAALTASLFFLWQARTSDGQARSALEKFQLLSTLATLERATTEADTLDPAWPERLADIDAWIADYGELPEELPVLERTLADLRARATERTDGSLALPTIDEQFQFDSLNRLVAGLKRFAAAGGALSKVRANREWAASIRTRSIDRHRASWDRARAAIRGADGITASGLYAATPIDLEPQLGLVPLGMNPNTGLWEFAHLRSTSDPGILPRRGPDGWIEVEDGTGIVFALVPGGAALLGAQGEDPEKPGYDPLSSPMDAAPHEAEIAPLFVAVHEMTQGQWERLSGGARPSALDAENLELQELMALPRRVTDTHPVEMVSWQDCLKVFARYGLRMLSSDEWEYVARAGTRTAFSFGPGILGIVDHANTLDVSGILANVTFRDAVTHDDGYSHHSPVDTFHPNPWGFFDMHGNVYEWCNDALADAAYVARSGSFHYGMLSARSAHREFAPRTLRTMVAGARAARTLNRPNTE